VKAASASLERADRLLRLADPVSPESLASVGETPAAREALAHILSEGPPKAARTGRRFLPRLAQGAFAAVAAGALVALMGALILFVRGEDDPPAARVAPPPIHYGIFDRPETVEEASILDGFFPTERIAPKTVRLADSDAGNRYILARTSSGAICLGVRGRRGGGASGCGVGGQPHVSLAGGMVLDNAHILYGLVPDAIVEVVVNGRPVPVVGNVFHTALDPLTKRAVIDYRTADGVVSAWREAIPTVVAGLLPPVRVEPFGAQARALQTRVPYLGVSCPKANSFACDRVGLAVWLRKPALQVIAKIAGRRVVLDDPAWSGPLKDGRRRRFAGFLRPAGLLDGPLRIVTNGGGTRWLGNPPVTAKVLIIVTHEPGSASTAVMRVRLSPGWG
jgi:hypothetical protein